DFEHFRDVRLLFRDVRREKHQRRHAAVEQRGTEKSLGRIRGHFASWVGTAIFERLCFFNSSMTEIHCCAVVFASSRSSMIGGFGSFANAVRRTESWRSVSGVSPSNTLPLGRMVIVS